MRAYSRAGFRLLPALGASGTSLRARPSRLWSRPSSAPAFAVDEAHLRASGGRAVRLADGRDGVAVVHVVAGRGTGIDVLTAADDATAADLLRGALALVDGPSEVGPLAPQQHWAFPVLLDAGLSLEVTGPVAVAGVADPLAGPCPPDAVFV